MSYIFPAPLPAARVVDGSPRGVTRPHALYTLTTESVLSKKSKISFFREMRHAYGRTALVLSGGGSFGFFHFGGRLVAFEWVGLGGCAPSIDLLSCSTSKRTKRVIISPFLLASCAGPAPYQPLAPHRFGEQRRLHWYGKYRNVLWVHRMARVARVRPHSSSHPLACSLALS